MSQPAPDEAPQMILIGPAGAGKSTLGQEIAARTQTSFIDLDAIADRYYAEKGWTVAKVHERISAVGRIAAEREWEAARAHAVVRLAVDHPGAIVALGAGHTSYSDGRHLAKVRAALRGCPDIIQLLPSPSRDASLSILRQRCVACKGRTWIIDAHDFLAHWLDDPGPRLIATRTIYTLGETPAETAARLLRDI